MKKEDREREARARDEKYMEELIAAAPPLTPELADLIVRTFGKAQAEPAQEEPPTTPEEKP